MHTGSHNLGAQLTRTLVLLVAALALLGCGPRSSGSLLLEFEAGARLLYRMSATTEIIITAPGRATERVERERASGRLEIEIVDVLRDGREATLRSRTFLEDVQENTPANTTLSAIESGRPINYVMDNQGRITDPGDLRQVITDTLEGAMRDFESPLPFDGEVLVAQLTPLLEEMMGTPWGGSFRYFREEPVQKGSTWTTNYQTRLETSTTRWVVARDNQMVRRLEFSGSGIHQMGLLTVSAEPEVAQVEYSGFFDVDPESSWPIRAKTVQEVFTVNKEGFTVTTRSSSEIESIGK